MVAYATRQQVWTLGLRAEGFAVRPRAVETVDAANGVLCITNNGLYTDAPIFRFQIDGSAVPGKPSDGLPGGLSASLVYSAAPVSGSSDLFRVVPVGGSVITSFTDAGSGVFSVRADLGSTIDAIAANESANINNALTGHSPPILVDSLTGLYPEILVGVCARRTAVRAALVMGTSNANYADSLKMLIAGQADDDARLKEWIAGREILPAVTDQDTVPNDAPRVHGRRPLGFGCRRTL